MPRSNVHLKPRLRACGGTFNAWGWQGSQAQEAPTTREFQGCCGAGRAAWRISKQATAERCARGAAGARAAPATRRAAPLRGLPLLVDDAEGDVLVGRPC
jgi:hypothetical protein